MKWQHQTAGRATIELVEGCATGGVINATEVLDLVAEHSHVAASRSNGTAEVYKVTDDGNLGLDVSLRGSQSAVASTLLTHGASGELFAIRMVAACHMKNQRFLTFETNGINTAHLSLSAASIVTRLGYMGVVQAIYMP